MDYEGRLARVIDGLDDNEIDALFVTDLTNVRYLTGFSGTNGQLLISSNGAVFFSDPRYEARAADLVKSAEIVIYPNRLRDVLLQRVKGESAKRLGIEASSVTLAERDDLAEHLDDIELVATKGVVEDLRRFKEPAEVDLIRQAIALSDEAFSWILDRLAPGRRERDIALDLEVHMRSQGAEATSFEPIVGSGPLSAHIHHTASDRPLATGDLVLMDFGAQVQGYCSDLTRSVVLGSGTQEQKAQYATVLAAQKAGIEALGPGASGRVVDGAARAVIAEAGHADHFGHNLGHGVGLDIHEAPRLGETSEDDLGAGDVVTVEPGVYLVGSGGIRIEDCVLVTDGGAEVLGGAPKAELIAIGSGA